MYLIFIDESGYSFNWIKDAEKQPYYVLSAVCVPISEYKAGCSELRLKLQQSGLSNAKELGLGFEVKAKEIAKGQGLFADERLRNSIRDNMLSEEPLCGGRAILIVIDKLNHIKRYSDPTPPHKLALDFMIERIQGFLTENNSDGFIVYDRNKKEETGFFKQIKSLFITGSMVVSRINFKEYYHKIDRIIEFSMNDSTYSVGLQLADFYATMSYQYHKQNKPTDCGWWVTLEKNLYRKSGVLNGYGYKFFP